MVRHLTTIRNRESSSLLSSNTSLNRSFRARAPSCKTFKYGLDAEEPCHASEECPQNIFLAW